MGSPSARLKTPEKLRPWLESGLEFVLNTGGAGQGVVQEREQTSAPRQPIQQSAPQPNQVQQQAVQQPVQVQQQAVSHQPVQTSAQQSPQSAHAGSQQNLFPEPWTTFFAKAPAHPKVVWTYMELGLDLAGQSDPKRAAVLRNLLSHHLKWPPGTTAFWPVAALKNNALQPNRNMFWRGWEQWKTPYIACFGEEALRVIHPEAEPGGTTYLLEQVTIFVLPPLAKLITMLPHEQQLSVDALTGIRY